MFINQSTPRINSVICLTLILIMSILTIIISPIMIYVSYSIINLDEEDSIVKSTYFTIKIIICCILELLGILIFIETIITVFINYSYFNGQDNQNDNESYIPYT